MFLQFFLSKSSKFDFFRSWPKVTTTFWTITPRPYKVLKTMSESNCLNETPVFLARTPSSPLLYLQEHESTRYFLRRYLQTISCEQIVKDFGFAVSINATIPENRESGRRQQLDSAKKLKQKQKQKHLRNKAWKTSDVWT